jgi:germination protein M
MRASLGSVTRRAYLLGVVVLVVAAVAVLAVACGTSGEVGDGGTVSTTQPSETTTPTEPSDTTSTTTAPSDTTTTSTTAVEDTMTVKVYFARGEKIAAASRVIPKTQQVGAAAMKALLEGPTAAEKEGGMTTSIPEGTTFLDLEVQNGIATINLSKEYSSGGGTLSMMMRLAQVVFTLTQFPTVEGVSFALDGVPIDVLGGEGIIIDHPMTRADYEDLSPAILVESPTLGNTVSSPVRITGTANVFEAVFSVNIVDWDGLIIADEVVTATSGTGTRGTFDVTIPFEVDAAGPGGIIVFAESPQDGSQIDVIEIPVELE